MMLLSYNVRCTLRYVPSLFLPDPLSCRVHLIKINENKNRGSKDKNKTNTNWHALTRALHLVHTGMHTHTRAHAHTRSLSLPHAFTSSLSHSPDPFNSANVAAMPVATKGWLWTKPIWSSLSPSSSDSSAMSIFTHSSLPSTAPKKGKRKGEKGEKVVDKHWLLIQLNTFHIVLVVLYFSVKFNCSTFTTVARSNLIYYELKFRSCDRVSANVDKDSRGSKKLGGS